MEALTLLLLCQLVGEFVVRLVGAPVPGPVLGLALLFLALSARGAISGNGGAVPDKLRGTSRLLLEHLSLLFVPAGTGILTHLPRLEAEWLPLAVTLLVSTALTIAVTAAVFVFVARMTGAGAERAR